MSTKFEQLLDYLVNEEMDKANELFHEIVVEKSREIYENLISEEEEEAEESTDIDEESVEEGDYSEEEESVEEGDYSEEEESVEEEELEDSFNLEADDGDSTDKLLRGVQADASDQFDASIERDAFDTDKEMGSEEPEDDAMMDIKNAIEELEAAFAELEASKGLGGMGSDFDSDTSMKPEVPTGDDDDLKMGMYEGKKKRMTREYVEKVGNDWEKNSMKTDGDEAGAGTGEKMSKPVAGKSPISSGKGKPTTGATAANILGDKSTGEGTNVGTKATGKAGGLVKPAQDMKTGQGNVPGGKMGVKNLSKVAHGHGAEKKGAGPGPVGDGTGDNAGQTSIAPETKKQFLPSQAK